MGGFHQYQRVRLTAVRRDFRLHECVPGTRVPRTGDIATILEIYRKPPGYELECVDQRTGETYWLASVAPGDVSLEAADTEE